MNNEWLCYDGPIEPSEEIASMSDAELEEEFNKRFGDIAKELS